MNENTIQLAIKHASTFKGNTIDIENHIITIPFSAGRTEDDINELMESGSLCNWYIENGFNVSFEVRDVEYMTKATVTSRSLIYNKPRKAFLRNRLVATITW